jgi:dUTP pyrophosphatase
MESTYIFELLPSASATPFYTSSQRSDENAGFDLFVPEEHTLQPGEKKLISMGVKGKMIKRNPFIKEHPVHYWMPPRSSISKTGLILLNSIGVIDKTYRGELMAFVQNISTAPVTVKKGDRLVQIVAPDMGHIKEIKIVEELDETQRGEGGFGSTGK